MTISLCELIDISTDALKYLKWQSVLKMAIFVELLVILC